MVCSCFVYSFDAVLEIITTICSFVVNLNVRSPGASELHLKMYFDSCSENDVNHDVIIFAFISKRSKFESYNLSQLLAIPREVKL